MPSTGPVHSQSTSCEEMRADSSINTSSLSSLFTRLTRQQHTPLAFPTCSLHLAPASRHAAKHLLSCLLPPRTSFRQQEEHTGLLRWCYFWVTDAGIQTICNIQKKMILTFTDLIRHPKQGCRRRLGPGSLLPCCTSHCTETELGNRTEAALHRFHLHGARAEVCLPASQLSIIFIIPQSAFA